MKNHIGGDLLYQDTFGFKHKIDDQNSMTFNPISKKVYPHQGQIINLKNTQAEIQLKEKGYQEKLTSTRNRHKKNKRIVQLTAKGNQKIKKIPKKIRVQEMLKNQKKLKQFFDILGK